MILLLLLLAFAQAPPPDLRQLVEAGLKARATGDFDAAAREFQRVAEIAPDLAAAHVNLGGVYFQKKDYAKAVPPLRRALELKASCRARIKCLVRLYWRKGRPSRRSRIWRKRRQMTC